jgi:hypothetical protein
MNMLDDRLPKVLKDFQFRSPFESKGCKPIVPLTKALALMKKIEQDPHLHSYVHSHFIVFHCNNPHSHDTWIQWTGLIFNLYVATIAASTSSYTEVYLGYEVFSIVDQFNHKKVLGEWIFDFLLTYIRHNDIVHKSDAARYRICISLFFFVSIHTPCCHISLY